MREHAKIMIYWAKKIFASTNIKCMYIIIKTRVTDEKVFQNKFNYETPC